MLAQFRVNYSRFVGDPWFIELINNLEVASPEFRLWWTEHDILGRTDGRKEINHPLVGRLILNYVIFKVADSPNLEVVMYLPLPKSDTTLKLQQLLLNLLKNCWHIIKIDVGFVMLFLVVPMILI